MAECERRITLGGHKATAPNAATLPNPGQLNYVLRGKNKRGRAIKMVNALRLVR